MGVLIERRYQREAREALNHAIATSNDNPAVVIPTGGGKSFIIAECVRRWKERCPKFRVCILAHRKELVDQNSKELEGIYPDGDIGVFSAGLNRKETDRTILFAGIDSIYRHADLFWFDLIIVDEAHRIPVKGEGKYRTFIEECRAINPRMRVVGFTATPFRLDSGDICGPDFILNRICYEAKITDLIDAGYLCRLDSLVGDAPDLKGVKKSHGDFDSKQLGERMNEAGLVKRTINNALQVLNAKERKKCIWFCVDVAHCENVAAELKARGESAEYIVGTTPAAQRDALVERFKAGEFRHLLNVGVFTEGFNVKDVDAVALLRPTLSKSLYWQMVGRGLRVHPNKEYCAILDYANLIEEHGPLTDAKVRKVGMYECKKCEHKYSMVFDVCPKCGEPRQKEIPKEDDENKQAEYVRRMHGEKAANVDILGRKPTVYNVDDLFISVHIKDDSTVKKSYRLTWRSGLKTFNEWLCLWHRGYAKVKAMERFKEITGREWDGEDVDPYPSASIDMRDDAKRRVSQIVLKQDGKYPEIIKHVIREVA